MNWKLLQNSLVLSLATTALSVVLGLAAAVCATGLGKTLRRVCVGFGILALALPPFLVTNCWLHLLGFTGVWRSWLPFNIYSMPGAVLILSLMVFPVTMLLVCGAWMRLGQEQLESELGMSGWNLLRHLLLPLAAPALGLAMPLSFLLALTNFAVPALLQTKVYSAEIWVSFNTQFNYGEALKLCWPLVLALVAFLALFSRRSVSWPHLGNSVDGTLIRRRLGAGLFGSCCAVTILGLGLATVLPLLDLVTNVRTWSELSPALAAGRNAFAHSLFFAAVPATACLAFALLAWRKPIGSFLWLPFLVPGSLLGIGLILAFNRPGLASFYQSGWFVVFAFVIRYSALAWSGVGRASRGVDTLPADAARLGGASGWRLFRAATLPQVRSQLAAAWYITYLLCLWDVETLVLIVPPGAETLALRVFNMLHYGHTTQVNALCVWLLALALAPLLLERTWRALGQGWDRFRLRPARALGLLAVVFAGCQPESLSPAQAPVNSKLFASVQVIGARGNGAGQFNKPRSVALDKKDNLYVVDMTGRVQKFSPEGVFIKGWEMPQTDKGKPKGMCTDRTGRIVLIEPHYSRVNHFSEEGKLELQWGDSGTNTGQLMFPRGVAVGSKGDIYVSEYGLTERIQHFSPDGSKWLGTFGSLGEKPGEFTRAEGIGIDAQDCVHVADSCNHRVQVFSPEGRLLSVFGKAGSGPGEMSYPYDVRVDSAGAQFVCEFGNSRVQIFDAQNRLIDTLGGVGGGVGEMNNPWSIALDSRGNLYVADAGNHRVQKFLRKQSLSGVGAGEQRPPAGPKQS